MNFPRKFIAAVISDMPCWLFGDTDSDISLCGAIGMECVEKADPLLCSRSNDTVEFNLLNTFDTEKLVAFLSKLLP
jgi:hypothetical protein